MDGIKKITTWKVTKLSSAVSVFNKSVTCIIENDNICTCQHASLFNSVHVDVQKEVVFWKMFSIFSTGISASCMRLSVAVNAKKIQLKTKKTETETGWEMLLLRIDKIDVLLQIYMVIFFFWKCRNIFVQSKSNNFIKSGDELSLYSSYFN